MINRIDSGTWVHHGIAGIPRLWVSIVDVHLVDEGGAWQIRHKPQQSLLYDRLTTAQRVLSRVALPTGQSWLISEL